MKIGAFISAEYALSCGFISVVTQTEQVLAFAVILAEEIPKHAALAMLQGKPVVRNAMESSISAGLAYERQAVSLLLSIEDKPKGIEAFFK